VFYRCELVKLRWSHRFTDAYTIDFGGGVWRPRDRAIEWARAIRLDLEHHQIGLSPFGLSPGGGLEVVGRKDRLVD